MSKTKVFLGTGSLIIGLTFSSLAFAQVASSTPEGFIHFYRSGHFKAQGVVSSVNQSSFDLAVGGLRITVNVGKDTQVITPAGAELGDIAGINDGDMVEVSGKTASDDHTTVDAGRIEEGSLQEGNADFYGTVSNLTSNSFTLITARNDKAYIVTATPSTIVSVNGQKSHSFADLKDGSHVRIRGIWGQNNSSITATRAIVWLPRSKLSDDPSSHS